MPKSSIPNANSLTKKVKYFENYIKGLKVSKILEVFCVPNARENR